MSLASLHLGIEVPEYSVNVPWLVSRRSLYRYIPRVHFRFLPGPDGGWPVLKFTCLGIVGEFVFDFVTHPNRKLTKIQLSVDYTPISTENVVPSQLLSHLGNPRSRNMNIFRWFDDQIVIDCSVGIYFRRPDEPTFYSFSQLVICYSAGSPLHWNHPDVRKHPPFPFPGHFEG